MAVTIQSNPKAYTPSDNPVRWTFSSTNTGQANFSYFIEVYVNAVLSSTHIIFPSNGIYGFFEADEEAIRSVSPPAITTALAADAANYASIYIKVFERYGSPATNQASATSSTIRVFKAGMSAENFQSWVDNYPSPYVFASGSKYLNQFPRGERLLCAPGQRQWLMAITDTQDIVVNVLLYDEDDVLVTSYTNNTGNLGRIQIFDVSPSSLIVSTTLTQANFDASTYYKIRISNVGLTFMEDVIIYLDRSCDLYNTQRLHFLSSHGAIDSFSFTKANSTTREMERSSIQRQLGQWNTSDEYVDDPSLGNEHDYLVTSKGKISCTSDWISETVQNYIVNEMYESPLVYREPPYLITDTTRPIYRTKILNTSYKEGQNITDELLQERVEISYGTVRKSALI